MPYAAVERNEFIVGSKFQRDWIEGRGLWLLAAIYLGGVGGGLYIASVLVGWHTGLLVGIGITAILKGGAHLLFLTHPWKFWRIFWRPQTSWISRGIYFVSLFVVFGLAYYVMGGTTLKAISVFFALCLVIVPFVIFIAAHLALFSPSVLALAGICELVGAFILRYSILKAGISAPVAY